MSSTVNTASEKVRAACLINNNLYDRCTEKALAAAELEAEWCRAKKAAPDAGSTRAAFERKSGALRRIANWKRGLSALADKIVEAKSALSKYGVDAFETKAEASYAFACEFQFAVDDDERRHAERRVGLVPASKEASMINSLEDALNKAYSK
jgi:hypothetical protein